MECGGKWDSQANTPEQHVLAATHHNGAKFQDSGMGFKTRLYSFCYIMRYSECVKKLIIEEGSFESKNVTIFKFNI